MKQKQKKQVEPIPKKEVPSEFLENRERDEMIDDHGPAIIGERQQKPQLPED